MATGWDNGLCQDYCRGLSIWFASRLDARHTIRKHFMTQPNTQAPADERGAFESAYCEHADKETGGLLICNPAEIADMRDGDHYGERHVYLNCLWRGWQLRAALASQPAQADIVAWMWQHDETGRKGFVEVDQLAMGWQAANPRLHLVAPLRMAATTPPQAQPAPVAVAGLGRILCDDEVVTLQFKDEASADAFAASIEPSIEVDGMPPLRTAAPVAVDVVKAFQALYDAIDSCVELTPEVMLRARAALQSARSGQDGGDAGGEQVQRIDVQGVRVYGTPSAMVQDMPLIREVFGLAEDAQPAAVSAEGAGGARFWVGAQNDAWFIVYGDKPAQGNDHPNHEADRTAVAKVYDEALARRLCELANAAPAAPVQAGRGVGEKASFFTFDEGAGFDRHDTAEEAKRAAQEQIDFYRGEAADGWCGEVDSVCWGIILEQAKEVPAPCEDGREVDEDGDRLVDFVLAAPDAEVQA